MRQGKLNSYFVKVLSVPDFKNVLQAKSVTFPIDATVTSFLLVFPESLKAIPAPHPCAF